MSVDDSRLRCDDDDDEVEAVAVSAVVDGGVSPTKISKKSAFVGQSVRKERMKKWRQMEHGAGRRDRGGERGWEERRWEERGWEEREEE